MEVNMKEIQAELEKATAPIGELMKKQDAEIKGIRELVDAEMVKGKRPFYGTGGRKGIALAVSESEGFKSFMSGNTDRCRVDLPAQEFKALITGGPYDSDSPLVRPDRDMQIYAPVQREMTIRDLIPSVPTDSNLVEFTRETAFTNNAAIQAGEGKAKGESEFTFELAKAQVATIAHYVNVSRQALEDSASLQEHLDNRMTYGLRLKEEEELLEGVGDIEGILAPGNHVPFTRHPGAGATYLDVISAAQTQLQLTDNMPTGIVLNPEDWEVIRQLKDEDGNYLFGYPSSDLAPRIWGMRVVASNTLTGGTFIVGDFQRGALIRDRQTPTIELSRNHNDNFTKNIVTILVEERIALTVVRPSAMVVGMFTEST